jgi:membrane-associated phospholipid phosphatase
VLYISLWLYVPLVVVLLANRFELFSHGLACLGLSLAGFAIFFFWPTAVPTRPNDWVAHPGFAFLQSVDATGNACPSLHVAFAVLSATTLVRVLREIHAPRFVQAANWLWCVAIMYSTLATRQHVALDVAGGIALALAVVGWSRRRSPARVI